LWGNHLIIKAFNYQLVKGFFRLLGSVWVDGKKISLDSGLNPVRIAAKLTNYPVISEKLNLHCVD